MRKLVSLVFVFSIAMLFVLAVPRAFAKPGGAVSVDSDDTCDVDRQDSTLCGEGFIWLNTSSGPIGEGCILDCVLSCNDGSTPDCDIDDLASNSCLSSNENKTQWAAYPFTYSGATEDSVCSITVIATGCTDEKQNGTVAGDGFKNDCVEE